MTQPTFYEVNKDDDLSAFLNYLKDNRNYSPFTIKSYQIDIEQFLVFLQEENIKKTDVERGDIRLFLLRLNKEQLEASTIQRKISSLRHFYRFLVLYRQYSKNPFDLVSSPRKSKKLPSFFSHEEISTLLNDNQKRTDKYQKRDQAIMELLFASGLRASELINLKFQDVDFEEKSIKVLGKNNKQRITHFNNVTKDALLNYKNSLRVILLGNNEDNDIIFLNKEGKKLSERGLEYIVEEASKKAGFPLHVHPHMFRHSFATELMNNGADIRVIQELLGHSSVSTTSIYTDVSFQDLKETYDNCFPSLKDKKELNK